MLCTAGQVKQCYSGVGEDIKHWELVKCDGICYTEQSQLMGTSNT